MRIRIRMHTAMSISDTRLWQLISPALPVGGFGYSQGLEQAVEWGLVRNEQSAASWIGGILRHGIASTDLPLLKRIHAAWSIGAQSTAVALSDRLLAMRETNELRFEDRAMGQALARLMPTLGLEVPEATLSFAGAFAIATAQCGIGAREAMAGYAWAWAELQVAAAVKLVPLGHSAGQRLLWELGACLDDVVAAAAGLDEDRIGMSLPGVAIASARHETQYTRLFRS
jgi:urease accessory protein